MHKDMHNHAAEFREFFDSRRKGYVKNRVKKHQRNWHTRQRPKEGARLPVNDHDDIQVLHLIR